MQRDRDTKLTVCGHSANRADPLSTSFSTRFAFDDIVGSSDSMKRVFRVMNRVAAVDATVLIQGESGTGKELIARAIHRRSKRATGPFVAVNCGAIPDGLLESELFGHEPGAFTDARTLRLGLFEQARDGVLFLDEISALSLTAQIKLLRVLQERVVTRLGGAKTLPINVRVITAGNLPLEECVAAGTFRSDLYWRLNVLTILVPPLRERPGDVGLLTEALVARIAAEEAIPVPTLSADVIQALSLHDWPGNVRELENALRQAIISCEGDAVTLADLPARLRVQAAVRDIVAPNNSGNTLTSLAKRSATETERRLIVTALRLHGGQRSAAAKSLGINRRTLFDKMRKYAIR